jgi:superfamily II DNA helicase RecQ
MDGVYLRGVNRMALVMHPIIHEFDEHLRNASEILGEKTPDFTDLEKTNEVKLEVDEELFQKLRQWRTQQAATEKIAHYMVMRDTTLRELAARKPQTTQALLGIKGMGKAKVEKYGPALLSLLTN